MSCWGSYEIATVAIAASGLIVAIIGVLYTRKVANKATDIEKEVKTENMERKDEKERAKSKEKAKKDIEYIAYFLAHNPLQTLPFIKITMENQGVESEENVFLCGLKRLENTIMVCEKYTDKDTPVLIKINRIIKVVWLNEDKYQEQKKIKKEIDERENNINQISWGDD